MRKLLSVLVFFILTMSVGYGQICGFVYDINSGNGSYGEIRVINGEFYLFGSTNVPFSVTMASIYLGSDTDSSINTLISLRNLADNGDGNSFYYGMGGKRTLVRQCGYGVPKCLVFVTDGVEGECRVLDSDFDYEMAIMAVGEYVPDLLSDY